MFAKHFGEYIEGFDVRVAAVRDMIRRQDQLNIADAPQDGHPLSILNRFDRISQCERSGGGLRNWTEIVIDHGDESHFVDFARHREYRVVGMIVLMIKGLQFVDGHVLDIGAVSDHGAP